ncbi:hypothetical protein G6O67_008060 [Ophiocordyceps sinensis]|uniref:Fido domain-containing protein n=1 Tax=Ophiocordyceps sinensis TaxID=72228 RepID=A0A8H4LS26_9HYPO|nr:hypothetical protein G6O67_008060 [Ophiocordyceps sinensis]
MIIAVFGSNMIERAGLGWDITLHLCRRIIAGEDVGEISERDADYQDALVKLCMQQPNLENMPCHAILRGRNEIVQHVKAFQHLINAFVTDKQSLSEDLIKETHRILTKGTPIIQDGSPNVAPEAYGGTYRTVIVGAGSSNFTVPKYVPTNTKEMCDNLEKEVVTAEKGGATDPFSLAAKYSLEFVQIHPFQDGNGRICRMILNAILCRSAGVIIPIGEKGEERSEYIEIKKRACELPRRDPIAQPARRFHGPRGQVLASTHPGRERHAVCSPRL